MYFSYDDLEDGPREDPPSRVVLVLGGGDAEVEGEDEPDTVVLEIVLKGI